MSDVSRDELELAFAHYCDVREHAIATGNWAPWGALFTEDARYVEHAYGEFRGRKAIQEWIVGVMEPFPTMTSVALALRRGLPSKTFIGPAIPACSS